MLETDHLLRPKGAGGGFGGGGEYNFKTSSFGGGVNISLMRNVKDVKFYDTASAV